MAVQAGILWVTITGRGYLPVASASDPPALIVIIFSHFIIFFTSCEQGDECLQL